MEHLWWKGKHGRSQIDVPIILLEESVEPESVTDSNRLDPLLDTGREGELCRR